MNSKPKNSKTSSQQLKEVFTVRHKIGAYCKISLETKINLINDFGKNPYPETSELEKISEKHGIEITKLKNWYKYYQKKLALEENQSTRKMKKKHRFSKDEEAILEEAFAENPKLSARKFEELENSLNCKRIHIQRWFSYRNKKLRKIKIKEKTEKASQINVDQVFTNNQKEIQQTSSPTENIQNNSNANINRSNFLSMQQMFQPLNQFPTFPIDWKNFANYQMLNNWNFTSQYLNSLQTNMANAYQNYFTRRYF